VEKSRNLQRLGYRRIVQLLVYLVIIPTVLLLSLGIILMFLGEARARINLILGILVVSFVSVVPSPRSIFSPRRSIARARIRRPSTSA